MQNIRVIDNGNAFCISVDGLIVSAHHSLGDAWRRIAWMYLVARQKFTVGDSKTISSEWYTKMIENGYLTEKECFHPRNVD